MLKSIYIGEKMYPVPVPVKTMFDCFQWIGDTFSKDNTAITKVFLDNKEIELSNSFSFFKKMKLTKNSFLKIKLESPKDVSLQLLDTISKLSLGVHDDLRLFAFYLWGDKVQEHKRRFQQMKEDVVLILNMINHLNGFIEKSQLEMAPLNALRGLVKRVLKAIKDCEKNEEYRKIAQTLLLRLEPLLNEMKNESEKLQMIIFTSEINEQCDNLDVK